ncbi:hypothetical protein AW736_21075 [Termitidicoccus mucosus]|uniref:Pectate lyase n=2 Tax=Termitidicoccus mucosus TaxID=1184151 RepID=A0A178IDF0_9BACT|nr:hypothetical protein AW736_21075 [Opitutaceae bacterium TSB47]
MAVAAFIAAPAVLPALPGGSNDSIQENAAPHPEISVDAFGDSAGHWRHITNPHAVIQPRPDCPVYPPASIREIAANILLFQRSNGGWPKNYDMRAVLTEEEKASVRATRDARDTTFDNETTHAHVAYLAKASTLLCEPGYRAAVERGIDFILSAQMPNGGWPQSWPAPEGFAAFITFNDRVMAGNLTVLRDAANGANGFAWLDTARREKCRDAVARGIACVLACQYRTADGKLTGWGQQHNPQTLRPDHARSFEPPCICSEDTAGIVRFLMKIEKPSPGIIHAVKSAAAWLDAVKIAGRRVETSTSTPAVFPWHKTDQDKRIVDDPSAPPLWARMYEMETNRPFFCGVDGVKVYTFAEVDRDRRTGYNWHGYWPAEVLGQDYPAWLKAHP